MANAQATSTARVQITQAANIASTSTAIARSTNAAIAQTSTAIMRSTSTANARSTNTAIAFATVQAINNYIATLEAPAELVFGPESGSLQHDDDDFVEVSSSNVDLRDFIAEVRFLNPYSTEIGSWDYGFLFRDENGNNQFRLIIFSTGKWVLRNNIENADSTIIQSGYQLSNLNLNEGGSNTILLYCQDKKGILYINGKFVANLDLSARLNLGAVRIGTGISDGSEISGYSTDYKDFRVWEIP
jgi:hypothetical protein